MKYKLSERKVRIIKSVVEEYLNEPVPVSSGEIQRKYFKDLCSATLRSEMSTLEDFGYLVQPHTSSGRIPTALAYKFYIENFVDKTPLQLSEMQTIQDAFKYGVNKIEDIVKATAKVISDITNYTSVIVISDHNNIVIKEIKLVALDENSLLVIIITDNGVLKDNIVQLKNKVEEGFIKDATLILNRIFANLQLKDLMLTSLLIDRELAKFREIIETVVNMISNYQKNHSDNIFIESETKILDYPETTLESARHFLSIIDNKEMIADIMQDMSDIEFLVKIGKDETGIIDNCAVIAKKILVDGKEVGHAAVIGPKRMDYSRVMSVLSCISKTLEEL